MSNFKASSPLNPTSATFAGSFADSRCAARGLSNPSFCDRVEVRVRQLAYPEAIIGDVTEEAASVWVGVWEQRWTLGRVWAVA